MSLLRLLQLNHGEKYIKGGKKKKKKASRDMWRVHVK